MATKIVTTENELHSMISAMQNPYNKDNFIVRVDATEFDWEARQQARWVLKHPAANVKIEKLVHAPRSGAG